MTSGISQDRRRIEDQLLKKIGSPSFHFYWSIVCHWLSHAPCWGFNRHSSDRQSKNIISIPQYNSQGEIRSPIIPIHFWNRYRRTLCRFLYQNPYSLKASSLSSKGGCFALNSNHLYRLELYSKLLQLSAGAESQPHCRGKPSCTEHQLTAVSYIPNNPYSLLESISTNALLILISIKSLIPIKPYLSSKDRCLALNYNYLYR